MKTAFNKAAGLFCCGYKNPTTGLFNGCLPCAIKTADHILDAKYN